MSNIKAVVIADSVSSVSGKRITTYELQYPRFVHSEFLTHRMISKNSASSRAIPVAKMIENIRINPAIPSHWGKNQSGMQANEEHDAPVYIWNAQGVIPHPYSDRETAWLDAMDNAVSSAEAFAEAGYHKQIVNRITEPFQMMKVVATATEWDNFFWLRKHRDSQPEIRILAEKMWEAREKSNPQELRPGMWHTPYVSNLEVMDGDYVERLEYYIGDMVSGEGFQVLSLEDALKVSASMCAGVSYRTSDFTLEKANRVYDRLVTSTPVHASPFEHQATPLPYTDPADILKAVISGEDVQTGSEGFTAIHNTLGAMSGNFAHWVQYRQTIEGNTCWNY